MLNLTAERLKRKTPPPETKEAKPSRLSKLEFFFSKKVGEAMAKYNLVQDKDRILVAVSGGKDSISLLHVLEYKRKRLPIDYKITACYIDMDGDSRRRSMVEAYLKENNYEYVIEKSEQWQSRRKKDGSLNCFWCAFNRRKKLFETADRLGYNKIALGHHKDDIAETFLLNLFFHGEISTMLPKQSFFDGKFHVIRPLALCEEKFVIDYAKAFNFTAIKSHCPNFDNTKRATMKNVLRLVSEFNDDAKTNILRSMKRINSEYIIKGGKADGYRKR